MADPNDLPADEAVAYLRALLENSLVAITVCDPEGRVTVFNRGAEELTGYSSAEARGREVRSFFRFEDEVSDLQRRIQEEGGVGNHETELVHKDGQGVPVVLVISALRGPDGSLLGSLAVTVDVSERKALEQALQQSRVEAERCSDILLHEITNSVHTGAGYLQFLLSGQTGEIPEHRLEHLGVAHRAMRRAGRLVDQARVLAHHPGAEPDRAEEIDLVKAVRLAITATSLRYPDREIIVEQQVPDQAVALGAPVVEQVLENIVDNAVRHHRPGPVRVWIVVEPADAEGEPVWLVSVADDGPGLPPDDRSGLFERSTDDAEDGTSLGLPVAGALARYCGGGIVAEDRVPGRPEEGARLVLSLTRIEPGVRS